jgi:predicted HTH transcriptional regulator
VRLVAHLEFGLISAPQDKGAGPKSVQINYPKSESVSPTIHWHIPIIEHLRKEKNISAKAAQELWKISRRAATNRLKEMCAQGLLVEMSTGPRDPRKVFILAEHSN